MRLSDKEFHILQSRIMFDKRFSLALNWLERKGYKVSQADYYRTLGELEKNARGRLEEIAKNYPAYVADEIDKFKSIESSLWDEYNLEKSHTNRAGILMKIASIQPFYTSLLSGSQIILEDHAKKSIRSEPSLADLFGE